MYKLVVLSCIAAAAQAGIIAPGYAAAGYGLPLAYNGAYNGYAAHGLGYAAGYGSAAPAAYAAAPVAAAAYAAPAPVAVAAPAVAPIAYAPQHVETISHQGPPKAYAVPAPRIVEEAPIIEQAVEKVEQHGYSVRY